MNTKKNMPAKRARSIPISKPATGEEEWAALREPIASGWLTQGSKVAEFEKQFAERHGISGCFCGDDQQQLFLEVHRRCFFAAFGSMASKSSKQ